MKTLWQEYRGAIILAMLLVAIAVTTMGCQSFGVTPQPKLESPQEVVLQLYSEVKGAYIAAIDANTPTAVGAKPLMSNEQYRQTIGQIDGFKARVDQLRVALDAGRWETADPQSIADGLRLLRATIPGG